MEDSCIFCKIVSGDMEAAVVYQDDRVIAFEDIRPQAPHHVLIIPREHIDSLNDISKGDEPLVGHLVRIAAHVADQRGIADSGFRVIINSGPDAGQSVPHVHAHMLGGRSLAWPPG